MAKTDRKECHTENSQELTTYRKTRKSINKERHRTMPWYMHLYIAAWVGTSAMDPFLCCEKGEEEH